MLKVLAGKGYLVLGSFQRGGQKLKKLAFLLTPEGIHHRRFLTRGYLEGKTKEYHALHAELASLRAELEAAGHPPATRPVGPGEAGHPPATRHAEWAEADHHPSPLVGEEPGRGGTNPKRRPVY